MSIVDAIGTVVLLGGFWAALVAGVIWVAAGLAIAAGAAADRDIRLRQRARLRRLRPPG